MGSRFRDNRASGHVAFRIPSETHPAKPPLTYSASHLHQTWPTTSVLTNLLMLTSIRLHSRKPLTDSWRNDPTWSPQRLAIFSRSGGGEGDAGERQVSSCTAQHQTDEEGVQMGGEAKGNGFESFRHLSIASLLARRPQHIDPPSLSPSPPTSLRSGRGGRGRMDGDAHGVGLGGSTGQVEGFVRPPFSLRSALTTRSRTGAMPLHPVQTTTRLSSVRGSCPMMNLSARLFSSAKVTAGSSLTMNL